MSRTIVTLVCIEFSAAGLASAGQHDWPASGVFIAHHPSGLEYSAGTDWCRRYLDEFAIRDCSEQNPRIDVDHEGQSAVWFVLAAFTDSTAWRGVEFGLGTYNRDSFFFLDHGPCPPAGAAVLQIPTEGWPGPNQGIAFITSGEPWKGSIRPVYYFAGYAYAEDLIPLGVDPTKGWGGTAGTYVVAGAAADSSGEKDPCPGDAALSGQRPAEAFGAMGLGRDGVAVFPKTPPTALPPWLVLDPRTHLPKRLSDESIPDPEKMRGELHRYPPELIELLRHTNLAVELGLRDSSETVSPLLASGTLRGSDPGSANPSISFTLLADAAVVVRVFDMRGYLVCTPWKGRLGPGAHEIPIEIPPEAPVDTPSEKETRLDGRDWVGHYSVHLEIDGVMSGDALLDVRHRRSRPGE